MVKLISRGRDLVELPRITEVSGFYDETLQKNKQSKHIYPDLDPRFVIASKITENKKDYYNLMYINYRDKIHEPEEPKLVPGEDPAKTAQKRKDFEGDLKNSKRFINLAKVAPNFARQLTSDANGGSASIVYLYTNKFFKVTAAWVTLRQRSSAFTFTPDMPKIVAKKPEELRLMKQAVEEHWTETDADAKATIISSLARFRLGKARVGSNTPGGSRGSSIFNRISGSRRRGKVQGDRRMIPVGLKELRGGRRPSGDSNTGSSN